jgi:hypothetical protein
VIYFLLDSLALVGRSSEFLLDFLQGIIVGRDSSVSIATGYVPDGPGIESPCWRDFSHLFRPALEPTQTPVQWVPDLSQG